MNEIAVLSTTIPAPTPIELFEKFLRLSVANGSASPHTIKSYREGISLFFVWCNETKIEPETVNFDQVETYLSWLTSKYSKKTAALRMTAVRILYKAMQRWGLRQDNPAAGVKSPIDRTAFADRIMDKALSRDETRRLIGIIEHPSDCIGLRNKSMIYLMLYQGLRANEIITLSYGALDRVSWAAIMVNGKGARQRSVRLCNEAREALRAWVEHNANDFPLQDNRPVFDLSVKTLERIVKLYLMQIGAYRKYRTCHALRHTYATLAVLGQCDREALADSLGHADTKTTDIYIRAAGRIQNNPADAVTKAIESKTIWPQ